MLPFRTLCTCTVVLAGVRACGSVSSQWIEVEVLISMCIVEVKPWGTFSEVVLLIIGGDGVIVP